MYNMGYQSIALGLNWLHLKTTYFKNINIMGGLRLIKQKLISLKINL